MINNGQDNLLQFYKKSYFQLLRSYQKREENHDKSSKFQEHLKNKMELKYLEKIKEIQNRCVEDFERSEQEIERLKSRIEEEKFAKSRMLNQKEREWEEKETELQQYHDNFLAQLQSSFDEERKQLNKSYEETESVLLEEISLLNENVVPQPLERFDVSIGTELPELFEIGIGTGNRRLCDIGIGTGNEFMEKRLLGEQYEMRYNRPPLRSPIVEFPKKRKGGTPPKVAKGRICDNFTPVFFPRKEEKEKVKDDFTPLLFSHGRAKKRKRVLRGGSFNALNVNIPGFGRVSLEPQRKKRKRKPVINSATKKTKKVKKFHFIRVR